MTTLHTKPWCHALNRAIVTRVSANDVLDHPGVASGLIQALLLAPTSGGSDIESLMNIAEDCVKARPLYLHAITSSDFLKNVAANCHLPSYDLNGAEDAKARVSPALGLDIVNAAVAVCLQPDAYPVNVCHMIVEMLNHLSLVVPDSLKERVDVPAVFAGAIGLNDNPTHISASALLRLLDLPDTWADQSAIENMPAQCGRAMAAVGGWDRIRDVPFAAYPNQVPDPLDALLHMCFGRPRFIEAMATPPTRLWCADLSSCMPAQKLLPAETRP
ncbi:hypothetical protein BC828DRAFT_400552 [Blastocladiella britannica]|nr:hypothetical protein BC828DRAFT_400552 [Blastocladiella britannica]